MKKFLAPASFLAGLVVFAAFSESVLHPFNDLGYGTLSGRIQALGMYRGFENRGNGANASVGILLNYETPELAGFSGGFAYNYAPELLEHNRNEWMANDTIHVLNEGWLRYRLSALSLTNTAVSAGRRIENGCVFRADDYRQKSRSLEGVRLESSDLLGIHALLGHAWRMSNWIQAGDRWRFNDFGEVFGRDFDTRGITWGELVSTNLLDGLELALFDAYAWDVANLSGLRATWDFDENGSLVGYLRNERHVGKESDHGASAFGLSFRRRFGILTLEPGLFSVRGDGLLFQETTTGIDHPLGASMMLYAAPFNGGADTLFLKATAVLGKTTLYALYDFTRQDDGPFDRAQEIDLVAKRKLSESLSVAFKQAFGHRNYVRGADDATGVDSRLYLTYVF